MTIPSCHSDPATAGEESSEFIAAKRVLNYAAMPQHRAVGDIRDDRIFPAPVFLKKP